MKKTNIITLGSLAVICSVALSSFVKTSGMHPSSTGAPGEGNCSNASTGCHANATITNDNTNLVNTLTFSTPDSSYVPGQTYSITLKAQKSGITKFGFGVVALRTSNNSNQGTWIVTDAARTHTITGTGTMASRKYMTHSTNGTPAVSAGVGQWSFNWKAPSTDVGNIKFYYCTNATNNNGANTGDALYLSSFEIHPQSTTALNEYLGNSGWNMYYDQDMHSINLNFNLLKPTIVEVNVYNIQGQVVKSINPTQISAGECQQQIELPASMADGVYYLQILFNDQNETRKFII